MNIILKRTVRLESPDRSELEKFEAIGGLFSTKGHYAPTGADLWDYVQWWTPELKEQVFNRFGQAAKDRYCSIIGNAGNSSNTNEVEVEPEKPSAITLSSLRDRVKSVLDRSVSGEYWVLADIVNITGLKHKYFELADYDTHGQVKTQMRGLLYMRDMNILERFERESGVKLEKGMKVMIRVFYSYSMKYGESLKILEFNSDYTVGAMTAKVNKIKDRLAKNGLLNKNKQLLAPGEFTSIAVISPETAAGLKDFETKMSALNTYGVCKMDYYFAPFQGVTANAYITKAFQDIEKAISGGKHYDAVVIIRGGGDKASLYSLNEYDIAASVCSCSIPVICGIGHEVDNTIIDELACVRCPTPSMCATLILDVITGNVKNAENYLLKIGKNSENILSRCDAAIDAMFFRISANSQGAVSKAMVAVEDQYQSITTKVGRILDSQVAVVDHLFTDILNVTDKHLSTATADIDAMTNKILFHNPYETINRGYAMVRHDNKVTGSAKALTKGSEIEIIMRDGMVKAQII